MTQVELLDRAKSQGWVTMSSVTMQHLTTHKLMKGDKRLFIGPVYIEKDNELKAFDYSKAKEKEWVHYLN